MSKRASDRQKLTSKIIIYNLNNKNETSKTLTNCQKDSGQKKTAK